MQLPTELNILGHHLYGKINNSFSRVHSSETTFSLLISYFLQYSSSEGSLVPHNHTSALSLVFLTFDETPAPTGRLGLISFLESKLFNTFPVHTQCWSKMRLEEGSRCGTHVYPALQCHAQRQGSWKLCVSLFCPGIASTEAKGTSQAGAQTPLTIT